MSRWDDAIGLFIWSLPLIGLICGSLIGRRYGRPMIGGVAGIVSGVLAMGVAVVVLMAAIWSGVG